MICQHFGLPIDFVTTFFDTIQNIQMYLMIVYGLSNNFYSGQVLPFQGLIQGNGAISPRFLLIAIILIRYLYYKKLIPESVLPITNKIFTLVG